MLCQLSQHKKSFAVVWGFVGCKLHLGQQIKLHSVVTKSSFIWLKGCLISPSGHWLFWCLGYKASLWVFKVQPCRPKPQGDTCLSSESYFRYQGSWALESNNTLSLQIYCDLCLCAGTKWGNGDVFLCSSVSPTVFPSCHVDPNYYYFFFFGLSSFSQNNNFDLSTLCAKCSFCFILWPRDRKRLVFIPIIKALPKNVQTTIPLHSSHMLARLCS